MPCMKCRNVVLLSSDLQGFDGGLQTIACTDLSLCIQNTDEDQWYKHDRLAASQPVLGVGAFKEIQQALGQNFNPDGVLADVPLRSHVRPSSTHTYDPMHVMYANGLFHFEMDCLWKACKDYNIDIMAEMAELADANWTRPKKRPNSVARNLAFHKTRAIKDGFTCFASEAIALGPFVLHYVERVLALDDRLTDAVASYKAYMKLSDLVQAGKLRFDAYTDADLATASNMLYAAAKDHLEKYIRAYGEGCVKPKHHMSLHLGQQLLRDARVLDCFVHERKHRAMKAGASSVTNPQRYERSVLQRVVVDQMKSLEKEITPQCLVGKRILCPEFGPNVWMALAVDYNHCETHAGDVVYIDGMLVLCEAAIESEILGHALVVRRLAPLVQLSGSTQRCRLDDDFATVDLSSNPEIRHAAFWAYETAKQLLVVS